MSCQLYWCLFQWNSIYCLKITLIINIELVCHCALLTAVWFQNMLFVMTFDGCCCVFALCSFDALVSVRGFLGSSVGGSVWGICPYACPGRPHRSLAAQVVLMSFLTASSRGRPSARRRPIQAAWVRFWQTQSSFLHVLATTTGAVSQRPCKGHFHCHLI